MILDPPYRALCVSSSGRFWQIIIDSGRFWQNLADSGRVWPILDDSGYQEFAKIGTALRNVVPYSNSN